MAGLASSIYNALFRRNTVMLGTVFASAFAMQLGFDTGSEKIWNSINQGRQWKDIKHKFMEQAEDDEE
ncbi:ubiquinol-cytochrome C reductase [Amniculicola lignicola CBS 123094]|uniref:Complex III subunit 9 n=1 Tax=Amniculicola lignicola CBS 123094 TaxID=1392246 RepID=A0A6A5X1R4_9PLEO|nr:ubiquinol-cytochrome C reductase [Amniculicola lignicola CBS 123094]